MTLTQLIRPQIRALHAYQVADAGGLLKLDAMENPYSWPGELLEAWLDKLREVELNRYPDPEAQQLKTRLRDAYAIASELEILLGNGSDELIQLIALAVAQPGRVLLAPEPSFVMYKMVAAFVGMDYVGVPLRSADFALDVPAMLAAIEQHQPAVIFLAYPNNPTGNCFDVQAVADIVAAAPGLVVIDEAYYAFAKYSFIKQMTHYDHVLLMRTVSKIGLAGLRLGFLLGAKHWLTEIEKLRLPYNINSLTQLSAEFALQHKATLNKQAEQICQNRTELQRTLSALPGLTVYPSEANFILFRLPTGQAEVVFAELKQAGILVKNLHSSGGLLTDCLRVTVGTAEQNAHFAATLSVSLHDLNEGTNTYAGNMGNRA